MNHPIQSQQSELWTGVFYFNTTRCQCVPRYSWKTVAMLYKDIDGSPEAILALNTGMIH